MSACPEGLALAATDGSQSAASAVCVDASHDLEVGQCVTRLRLLVAAGFAMTLISASLALGWWSGIGDYETTAGYAGLVVFGLVTCRLIWLLPSERGPVVIVTAYGIRDLRIGNEFLLWESIAEVSSEERRGRRVIVLTPTPALQRQLSCIGAKIRATSRGAQDNRIGNCVVIRPEGLATDFDTLLRACSDCHAAANSPTALRRDRDHDAPTLAVRAS